jgi:hypothetical protein
MIKGGHTNGAQDDDGEEPELGMSHPVGLTVLVLEGPSLTPPSVYYFLWRHALTLSLHCPRYC